MLSNARVVVDKYDAIARGVEWAREHGLSKPHDVAICVIAELNKAEFVIQRRPVSREDGE